MSDQSQKVTGSSVAIQSGRDTTINQGLTATDMKQIIEAIASQHTAYAAVARELVDARLTNFEQRILERFANPNTARSEAFKDPDFQYTFSRAQIAYARSGDETIRDMLVDLIAQRSKHTDRTRLTLSLNDAVERAALLTANEFAELSLTYLLRYTQHSARNLAAFVEHLNTSVAPFMSDISTEESSYSYLEAQSCAVTSVMSTDLYSIWKQLYGGLFSKGLTNEQILAHLPDGKKGILEGTALVLRCLNDATKFQLNAVNREVFHREAARVALDKNERDNLWNMFEGSMWSKQELIDNLLPRVPTIKRLVELWDTTPLNHLTLTSVGIAIAHANCVRLVGLDADLAIWIK